jgi:hypothetical protein
MPVMVDEPPSWRADVLIGRGYSERDSRSNAAFVDVIGPGRVLANGFVISPVGTIGAIGDIPRLDFNRDRTIWFAGAGGRIDVWDGFFASFEVGAVNHRTQVFSSTYQFATSLGWSWKQFVVSLRHVSNGGLEGKNYGETMVLAGIHF